MTQPLETLKLPNGLLLSIYVDDDAESPLTDSDAGRAYCWHRRYNLGHYDLNPFQSPQDLLRELYEEFHRRSTSGLEKAGVLMMPLYLYDHSGITMSTSPYSCPWDSGQVGWWVLKPAEISAEWDGDRAKAREYVNGVIETYAAYLEGECYRFRTEDAFGETVDSCGGFIGSDHWASGLYETAGVPAPVDNPV